MLNASSKSYCPCLKKIVNSVLLYYSITLKNEKNKSHAVKVVRITLVHEPAWLVGTKLGNNAYGNFWEGIHL